MEYLEEQKNNGNLTLEEYDTLRIRYERKLGNKKEVSRLQEAKGFKPSKITERKAKKEEYYDDFVDGYSSVKSEEYSEITSKEVFSSKTTKIILVLFVLLAFGVGIIAGISTLNTVQNETPTNITVTDSAFSSNDTVVSAQNMTVDNATLNLTTTNKTKSTVKSTNTKKSSGSTKKTTKKSSSSSSSGSSSSSRGSSGSSSSSSGSSGSGSSSTYGSSSGSGSSSGGSGSSSGSSNGTG